MLKPRLFDAHTHLQFKAFDKDREEVILRALDGGVFCINVGTQKDTSKAALNLAQKYDGLWAAVGLHPIHTQESYYDPDELAGEKSFKSREEIFDPAFYEKLAENPKVVAIGECGLDYFRIRNDESRIKEKQEKVFKQQIELALKLDKPLMIHCRDAYNDVLDILRDYPDVRGNIHFFAGDWQIAEKFLDLGFYLSFTGVITFARQYDEVLKKMPLERLMIETDAPYVSPASYRGKRNEPLYVVEVAKRIAEIRGLSFSEVAELTAQNAKRVFGLDF
jgi:TatD DNase family protein